MTDEKDLPASDDPDFGEDGGDGAEDADESQSGDFTDEMNRLYGDENNGSTDSPTT